MSSRIRLTQERGWSTCEDCGSYDWAVTKMIVGGKVARVWNYDSHLAGGHRFDELDAVKEVLEALGHEVRIEEWDNDEPM